MSTSDILKAAKARLTSETWGQGDGGRFVTGIPEGKLCAAMAIARQPQQFEELYTAVKLLTRAATGRNNESSLICWNDTPGRALQDVHDAYDAAIAIAEQQEAAAALAEMPEGAEVKA